MAMIQIEEIRSRGSVIRNFINGRLKRDEAGTVAILTIGLFLVAVAALALITDVAAIGVAKRSLIHITEAAALHGSHALDLREYYKNGASPGVPIDCFAARRRIDEELHSLNGSGSAFTRPELSKFEVIQFRCSGSDLEITTTAIVNLPFRLPQSTLSNVEIHATVGVTSQRRG